MGFGSINNPSSNVYASLPSQRESVRAVKLDIPPESDSEGLLLSGTLSLDLGSATLKSITGYMDYDTSNHVDIDGSADISARLR